MSEVGNVTGGVGGNVVAQTPGTNSGGAVAGGGVSGEGNFGGNNVVQEVSDSSGPPPIVADDWLCNVCGARNPASATSCGTCESPRVITQAEFDQMQAFARVLEDLGNAVNEAAKDESDPSTAKEMRDEAEGNFERASDLQRRGLELHKHIQG